LCINIFISSGNDCGGHSNWCRATYSNMVGKRTVMYLQVDSKKAELNQNNVQLRWSIRVVFPSSYNRNVAKGNLRCIWMKERSKKVIF